MWHDIMCFFVCFMLANAQYKLVPISCPYIIQRDEWEANLQTRIEYVVTPLQKVILYKTHRPQCSDLKSCRQQLKDLELLNMYVWQFNNIGYNFVIGGDGNIYEGAGWSRKGAVDDNTALLVAITGFMNDSVKAQQSEQFKRLIKCAIDLGELSENYTLHREGSENILPIVCPPIIPREKWTQSLTNKIDYSEERLDCVHTQYHNTTDTCDNLSTCTEMFSRLQDYYQKINQIGLPYHFIMDRMGNVYEVLGWNRKSVTMYKCIEFAIFGTNTGPVSRSRQRMKQCLAQMF